MAAAINNSDLPHLSPDDAIERDCLLAIDEIDSNAATPLQAVKLLALYLSNPHDKESTISSLKEWLADPAIGNNAILRLIAGTIFMHEEDYNEALKHTNAGGTMELNALNVQIFIKMHRSDYAERQLRVMQQIDEDHTLTQLANAWLNLAVDAKDPETLANLVVCSLHLGKSSSRYLSQLKLTHPEHILVKRSSAAEDSFERALQTVA
ncbi:Coatomer, epsilon subunit [Corchorus olitorius]|uniref:Coatomer, epsilon subunit n=1 Tax=Corchorus olitorius TaxID=93759 RepID=A0A1R3HTM5_9ROSI|nr:Coatomer, epsilon subunit [Corchorus olitorius]